ncbi:hypothetical protein MyChFU_18630 [Mycobacterium intracellulare subsp. chimaera]
MCGLRESVESSSLAGKVGVDASWVDAAVSAFQFVLAGPPGLGLLGNRGDSIESDALSGKAAGARWRCPFGLADPRRARGLIVVS